MFIVTGVDIHGKRFSMRFESERMAMAINLWRGSVWREIAGGKRKLVKRVYN